MFKFLKSKKGFTLVELMIVVVIMAILVAVAVPIYSAVTANARKRSCAANQREIQGQFNTASMNQFLTVDDGDVFTLTTDKEGESGEWEQTDGIDADTIAENERVAESLFNSSPYCPNPNAVISVEISVILNAGEKAYLFKTSCDQDGH